MTDTGMGLIDTKGLQQLLSTPDRPFGYPRARELMRGGRLKTITLGKTQYTKREWVEAFIEGGAEGGARTEDNPE